ncbi:hypothetical protein BJB45_09690 [Halomonas huangheensis]|uniref:Uncharacterized protein n=1 Tax=Halomonas huangheensis TaxID=1178482 RepID=W1N9P6_9GAMM|nr:hypothetical protein BJB45_09690 [Halomonas huangheensis]
MALKLCWFINLYWLINAPRLLSSLAPAFDQSGWRIRQKSNL